MIQHAIDCFGRMDCLFNNAGDASTGSGITDIDIQHFNAAIALHVGGALLGMKHAAPIMVRQQSGSIINMASVRASFRFDVLSFLALWLCDRLVRTRRDPFAETTSIANSALHECKQVAVEAVHMCDGQAMRRALVHGQLAAWYESCRLSPRKVNGGRGIIVTMDDYCPQ